MANTINTYSDLTIMKCFLRKNFAEIGRVFEDNVVTRIKAGAFYEAQNLDRITLPNAKDIGALAFYGVEAGTISLTWSIIEAVRYCAFWHCTSAGLPSTINLEKATLIDNGAFAGTADSPNTWLQSISIPLWTGTSSGMNKYVTGSVPGVFQYCTALVNVTLSELVSLPARIFSGDTSLVNISLPKCTAFTTGDFAQCTSLKKVDVGGAITSLSSTPFSGCSSLETVILRGITTVPTLSSNFFSDTTVAGGKAFIYVPKSLEETIKLASTWSSYASQIRAVEDYPEICGS